MLPGVEGGCSHVAMSSGEHEDEHDEVLSGVAAMESVEAVVLEEQRAEMARLLFGFRSDSSPAGRRFAFMATGHIVGHASRMCTPQWTQEKVARYPPSLQRE